MSLVDDLRARGIRKPVIPGIMPVTTVSGIERMARMGAAVPDEMATALRSAGDADAVRRAGISMATDLCRAVLDEGAPGLHFYTLNRSMATRQIYGELGLRAGAPSGA